MLPHAPFFCLTSATPFIHFFMSRNIAHATPFNINKILSDICAVSNSQHKIDRSIYMIKENT
jgi:hypothetical protein